MFVDRATYEELSVHARWLFGRRSVAAAGAAVPPPAPRSALSWEDHAWFLRAQAVSARGPLPSGEAARLALLAPAVAAEQAAYLRDRTAQVDPAALRWLSPTARAWAEAVLAGRRVRCVALPAAHAPVPCPLLAQPPPPAPPLQHVRLLAAVGGVAAALRPPPAGAALPAPPGAPPAHAPVRSDGVVLLHAERESCAGPVVCVCGSAWAALVGARASPCALPVCVRAPAPGCAHPVVCVDAPLALGAMTRRGANAALLGAAVRCACGAPPGQQPREHRLWRWGPLVLLTRCRGPWAGEDGRSPLLRVVLEHAPNVSVQGGGWTGLPTCCSLSSHGPLMCPNSPTQAGRQHQPPAVAATAWAATQLRPGCCVHTVRVGVAQACVLATARGAPPLCEAAPFDPENAMRTAHATLRALAALPPGDYALLPGDGVGGAQGTATLLRACDPDSPSARPLAAQLRACCVLHESDEGEAVRLRWQAAQPGVPQIPDTHPPHGAPAAPSRRRARQAARVGAAGHGGDADACG